MVELPKIVLRRLSITTDWLIGLTGVSPYLFPVPEPSGLGLFHSLETGWPKLPALIQVTCSWPFLVLNICSPQCEFSEDRIMI